MKAAVIIALAVALEAGFLLQVMVGAPAPRPEPPAARIEAPAATGPVAAPGARAGACPGSRARS